MTTALVKYSLEETKSVGAILAKSGFFRDSAGEAQAVAKILAGQELGFGPMAAMTGIYIVDGRVTISANLMAASVKRSGKYNYRVTLHTEQECEIAFFEKNDAGTWEEVGRSSMTMKEAVAAELDMAYDKGSGSLKKKTTWQKFPKNMLFARAMSNGVKWFCPDIMGGPVYTPDEFDLPVNEDGEVIEGVAIEVGGEPHKSAGMKGEDAPPDFNRAAAITDLLKHYGKRFTRKDIESALDKIDAADQTTAQVVEAFKARVAEADTRRMASELGGEIADPKAAA